jgi:acyl carrier protein phosphodiesterase
MNWSMITPETIVGAVLLVVITAALTWAMTQFAIGRKTALSQMKLELTMSNFMAEIRQTVTNIAAETKQSFVNISNENHQANVVVVSDMKHLIDLASKEAERAMDQVADVKGSITQLEVNFTKRQQVIAEQSIAVLDVAKELIAIVREQNAVIADAHKRGM